MDKDKHEIQEKIDKARQQFEEAREENARAQELLEEVREENAKEQERLEVYKKSMVGMRKVTKATAIAVMIIFPSALIIGILSIWIDGLWPIVNMLMGGMNFVVVLFMIYSNEHLVRTDAWKNMRKLQVVFWLALLFNMGSLANIIVGLI